MSNAPPSHFSGGVGFFVNGAIAVSAGNPTHYHQGMGFAANGDLCVDPAPAVPPDHFSQGGLPLDANNRLYVNTLDPITHYSHGFGFTADGHLAGVIA